MDLDTEQPTTFVELHILLYMFNFVLFPVLRSFRVVDLWVGIVTHVEPWASVQA
jgi:hypothetical protein